MQRSYLDRKEAWAKRMAEKGIINSKERAEGRLPPGQHTVKKLPVLDLGIQPKIEESDWILQVGGEVENELNLNWESLMEFDYLEEISDFHCVTTWSKYRPLGGQSHDPRDQQIHMTEAQNTSENCERNV